MSENINHIKDEQTGKVSNLKSYEDYFKNIRNLPSTPEIILEVSRLLDNPMTNASDLADLISRDQGMVAKILTVANSPFYGLSKKISTIEFAIVILGFENIKNIVIALSMIGAFKGKGKNWDRKKYWNHCLAAASISKRLAEDLGYFKSGEAFTAGLLHDLGVVIIQQYLNDKYNLIWEKTYSGKASFAEAEADILNSSHQKIGYFLAEKWNLPKPICDSILFHHNPVLCNENKILVSIVHLADYLTKEFEFGNFIWDKDSQIDLSIIPALGWGDELYMKEFIESYREIFQNKLEPIE